MTTPQPTEHQSAAPRRIGLHRFSAAEFLVALVLLFVVSPFVELIPGGNLIEAMLITLVLIMGGLAVGRRVAGQILGKKVDDSLNPSRLL